MVLPLLLANPKNTMLYCPIVAVQLTLNAENDSDSGKQIKNSPQSAKRNKHSQIKLLFL